MILVLALVLLMVLALARILRVLLAVLGLLVPLVVVVQQLWTLPVGRPTFTLVESYHAVAIALANH